MGNVQIFITSTFIAKVGIHFFCNWMASSRKFSRDHLLSLCSKLLYFKWQYHLIYFVFVCIFLGGSTCTPILTWVIFTGVSYVRTKELTINGITDRNHNFHCNNGYANIYIIYDWTICSSKFFRCSYWVIKKNASSSRRADDFTELNDYTLMMTLTYGIKYPGLAQLKYDICMH